MTRTYVVTGAASGIGRATVAALDRLGHRTVAVDRQAPTSTPTWRAPPVVRRWSTPCRS